jgi:hypothetical protein
LTDEPTPESENGSSDELELVLDAEEETAPHENAGPAISPALTDQEINLRGKQVELEKKEADLAQQRHTLDTEKDNRKLRKYVANGALLVMLAQVVAANGTFIWYGDTNGWDISPAAISSWMAATVAQVVSVVLVITNYLFPNPKGKDESS